MGLRGRLDLFFFKQKTAYDISACLVGSEMCIRDRIVGPKGYTLHLLSFDDDKPISAIWH